MMFVLSPVFRTLLTSSILAVYFVIPNSGARRNAYPYREHNLWLIDVKRFGLWRHHSFISEYIEHLLQLVVTTTHNLLVYALPTAPSPTKAATGSPKRRKKKSKANTDGRSETVSSLSLQKSVPLPSSTGEGSTFRSARYILPLFWWLVSYFFRHHPQDQRILFSVINSVPPRTRKTKTVTRRAYICIWNTETWDVERIKKVGDRGLTYFDIRYRILYLKFAILGPGLILKLVMMDASLAMAPRTWQSEY